MTADPPVKKLLILAANPNGTSPRRLDQEVREIEAGLQRAKKRDLFELEQRWAVQPRDVQRALLDVRPQIVHFAGQGEGSQGLVFEGEQDQAIVVDDAALAGLFELFSADIDCVVLNGCYSQMQADAIAQHIPYVVGTAATESTAKDPQKKAKKQPPPTEGEGAIAFAVGFYDAIGAGRTVEFAYRLGCNALSLEGLDNQLSPFVTKGPERPSEIKKPLQDDSATSDTEEPTEEELLPASEDDIYPTLLRLGYQKQSRLFRRLMQSESAAALLICGHPDYGQRWLLNRLVVQYVPHLLTGKKIVVDVGRRVRRNDLSALWRELASRVGLKGKPYSPADVAKQVSQCLQTQDVLLVFHEVESIPEDAFTELIDSFWKPLIEYVQADSTTHDGKYKLLLFLVDYDGCVGSGTFPFVQKLGAQWTPTKPIKSPTLSKFSSDDLMNWMDREYDKLPPVLAESNVDDSVAEILESSEEGVPEWALEAICDRCGHDWYDSLKKWLKL